VTHPQSSSAELSHSLDPKQTSTDPLPKPLVWLLVALLEEVITDKHAAVLGLDNRGRKYRLTLDENKAHVAGNAHQS
jgi:hypothetical protein